MLILTYLLWYLFWKIFDFFFPDFQGRILELFKFAYERTYIPTPVYWIDGATKVRSSAKKEFLLLDYLPILTDRYMISHVFRVES